MNSRIVYHIIYVVVFITGIGYSSSAYAQAKVVINNNGYIVLQNAVNLVIDNDSANALQTAGTGGNIVSEGENNVVQWHIGADTGMYIVPFSKYPVSQGSDGAKIPVSLNITHAGVGSGSVIFSTYQTNAANKPYPSDVTNMYSKDLQGDGSLYAVDRFWRIDAGTYTTKPSVNITFTYDSSKIETGDSNLLDIATLKAQRFNSTINDWQGLQYGTVNNANNTVSGVVIDSSDFYKSWTLVSTTFPLLPIFLINFTGTCDNNSVVLNWTTGSEYNTQYFEVERSTDGDKWVELATIRAARQSRDLKNYEWYTAAQTTRAYYRLKAENLDGTFTYSTIIRAGCSDEGDVQIYNNDGNALIRFHNAPGNYIIQLVDIIGRSIWNTSVNIQDGDASYNIPTLNMAKAMYVLHVYKSDYSVSQKIELNNN